MFLMIQNDCKAEPIQKIASAIKRFRVKFHVNPNRCLVHTSIPLPSRKGKPRVVIAHSQQSYAPIILFIGTAESE